jgi:hypothetical protein
MPDETYGSIEPLITIVLGLRVTAGGGLTKVRRLMRAKAFARIGCQRVNGEATTRAERDHV